MSAIDDTITIITAVLFVAALYGAYRIGKVVGRIESAEDRRLASETWALCHRVNALTNDIIRDVQSQEKPT